MCYHRSMTTTPGAEVAPFQTSTAIEGQVVGSAASPDSHNVHKFLQLLRSMASHSAAFKSEEEVLDAHRTFDAVRSAFIPLHDLHKVLRDTDPAPVEDVKLRRAPNATYVSQGSLAPIDYNALAEAIVAVQNRQARIAAAAAVPAPQAPAAIPPMVQIQKDNQAAPLTAPDVYDISSMPAE
jgi:hypothetical protein